MNKSELVSEVAEQTSQALAAQMAFGASALAGRTVTYVDPEGVEATGAVDAVRFTAAGPVLVIGDQEVPISSVVSVAATSPDSPTSL